jgi:C-terminal processing protease CtpA/Prc
VVGDTAYVTFDAFRMPSQDYYKVAPTADAKDTYGILEYAHAQITAAGDTIKNVVLDLSCNPGGSINAGVYAAGWFLPYSILSDTNALTGAEGSFTYQSDLNLDGQYTTADRISSKRLYCLISPASFSCSNLLASILKASDQVRFLGRGTRGGACIVQHLSLADGSFIQTSGNRKLCNVHNGAYQSIEDGVDVDYTIDKFDDMYNRTTLTSTIDSLN